MRRTTTTLLVATTGLALLAPTATAAPAAPTPAPAAAAAHTPLTNLAHLDFLRVPVDVRPVARHTTYRIGSDPRIDEVWTYADRNADGTYRRVGGGAYDPATNTYGQGAFNADDTTRAAVVYLRHWRQTGAAESRAAAYDLLRAVAYHQTTSGPDAGNVVLWMQPDGSLNPSADPPELPDPSDSADSYWLARTVWAYGEGYAAFRRADPAFARFLRARMDLAVRALRREVLSSYGRYQVVDGVRVPAWLVNDGADATAEAVLGLAAYVRAAGDDAPARRALRQLANGVARMSAGDARTWPFGAVLPWALSRSVWHAWASQMPAALATASVALRDRRLLAPAVRDSATFDPWLLTSGGPDNGRQPTATDRTQIAYGVDSRLQSLLATADAARRPAFRALAAVQAAWWFGANASGRPAYDPATGRSVDGISPEGNPNLNAGAESTIHGLLSMLALDAHPGVARQAQATARVDSRTGTQLVEAESGRLAGGATVVRPDSAWTGEALLSGGAYAALPAGSSLRLSVPASRQPRLVMPVVDLQPGSSAVTRWTSGWWPLGTVRSGAVGSQGVSPAPGALLPVTLPRWLPAGATTVTATARAAGDDAARVDAVMLEPYVSSYVLGGSGGGAAVLRSPSRWPAVGAVRVPGAARATVSAYDSGGRLRLRWTTASARVRAVVLPGGFTLVRR